MTFSRTLFAVSALALALATTEADALGLSKRKAPPAPPSSYLGQWYTTPDGCSYSRAQAPGYPPMWVLILNPHHIGQPPAGPHCATLLDVRG